jgi:hypothetical protein
MGCLCSRLTRPLPNPPAHLEVIGATSEARMLPDKARIVDDESMITGARNNSFDKFLADT